MCATLRYQMLKKGRSLSKDKMAYPSKVRQTLTNFCIKLDVSFHRSLTVVVMMVMIVVPHIDLNCKFILTRLGGFGSRFALAAYCNSSQDGIDISS